MSGATLFLAHRAPWPPDRGDRIRSWRLVEALARRGPVRLAALADSEADRQVALERLVPMSVAADIVVRGRPAPGSVLRALATGAPLSVAAFADAALHRAVRAAVAGGGVERIVVFSGQMMAYVPDDWRGPLLLDLVDVDSAKFEAFGRHGGALSPMRWVHAREGRTLARAEAAWARRADRTFLVSAAEAALFRKRSGLSADRVAAMDNGIDTDHFAPGVVAPVAADGAPRLVMTGQMDYRPNVEASDWFARQVLPRVRAVVPDACFIIVGRSPAPAVRALAALPGVTVTGAVDDVRGWIGGAAIAVAPLQTARGVQNKVLEAMAMARAVVATSAAAEGIDAEPGRELLVEDAPEAQAQAIIDLLAAPARAAAMGGAARERMIARYGWEACLAPLIGALGPRTETPTLEVAA